jgi:hypothetical protein
MSEAVKLVALRCIKCETPVPAQPGEVAWRCTNCGTGQMLDLTKGLVGQTIHFSDGLTPGATGRPFWVVEGAVTLSRESYDTFNKKGEAEKFWAAPRLFFIPAWAVGVDELIDTAMGLLDKPAGLKEGKAEAFLPVVLPVEDIQAVTEYIILGMEAHRRDDVKSVNFTLKLSDPGLWVLAQAR